MVISHKFTNNLILLVHPELLLTTLLSSGQASALAAKADPELGRPLSHVGSKNQVRTAEFEPFRHLERFGAQSKPFLSILKRF